MIAAVYAYKMTDMATIFLILSAAADSTIYLLDAVYIQILRFGIIRAHSLLYLQQNKILLENFLWDSTMR